MGADMFFYDEFQSQRAKGSRRPVLKNMYDVFETIRGDEAEHAATMRACQDPQTKVTSPNTEAAILTIAALALTLSQFPINLDSLDPFSEDMTSAVESAASALGGTATASKGFVEGGGGDAVEEGAEALEAGSLVAPQMLRQLSLWVDSLRKLF